MRAGRSLARVITEILRRLVSRVGSLRHRHAGAEGRHRRARARGGRPGSAGWRTAAIGVHDRIRPPLPGDVVVLVPGYGEAGANRVAPGPVREAPGPGHRPIGLLPTGAVRGGTIASELIRRTARPYQHE